MPPRFVRCARVACDRQSRRCRRRRGCLRGTVNTRRQDNTWKW
jgi:hypothetical protein